jgi:methionyl-tRNA formyltransferase
MRVVFMGTPDFSVPVLDALVGGGHEIACVYCQPPRPAGRGKKDRPSPVQARAEALGLPVRHPVSLKSPEAQAEFAALDADIAVVVAYGLILPQAVLDAPRHGCLNIHASLLPRWRGAAPIHRAIMAGDAETGVCIMQMEAGLDTGPVLLREALDIGPEETTGDLHDRLSALGAPADRGGAGAARHPDARAAARGRRHLRAKIDKAEARIDWTRDAVEIDRTIRGLSPFPGAWTARRPPQPLPAVRPGLAPALREDGGQPRGGCDQPRPRGFGGPRRQGGQRPRQHHRGDQRRRLGHQDPVVRINGLDTPYWYRDVVDLLEQAGDRLDQIMIPKVGCAADIYAVDALVTSIEAAKGRTKPIGFEVIIESAPASPMSKRSPPPRPACRR